MILVVGATGTVGRKVIAALSSNPQIPLRALSRGKSDWEGSLLPGFRRKGVEVVVGDLRSESIAARAVRGCTGIINCSGTMRGYPDADISSVNREGIENLIEAGTQAGVQRFVQLSCLGATEHATSLYFSCKWDAEELVRNSKFYWTIFKPSLIFDTESSLFRVLDFWVNRAPITLVVGSGLNRFQPISADDVAACIVGSVYDKETVGKVYDLVGPETFDLQTVLSMVAESRGRPPRSLRIPSFLGVPLAGLLAKLNPNCPVDNNVMSVLTAEMIADARPMLSKFNVTQQKLEPCLLENARLLESSAAAGKSKLLQKAGAGADSDADGEDEDEAEDEDAGESENDSQGTEGDRRGGRAKQAGKSGKGSKGTDSGEKKRK